MWPFKAVDFEPPKQAKCTADENCVWERRGGGGGRKGGCSMGRKPIN